jgi:hypothetical protein
MSLQEYDLEITPAQIVRGQGLCKLVLIQLKNMKVKLTP